MARRFPSPITTEYYERLIEGEIVEKMTPGDPHAMCVLVLTQLFRFRAPDDLVIGVQGPLWLPPDSVPEPDLFLLRLPTLHVRRRPLPSDIALLIEVCDTSFGWDRSVKAPLYARNGVSEVWLVDLNGQRLLRYRDPEPAPPEGWRKSGRTPTWGQQDILVRGNSVAPAACPQTRLTIDEILADVPPGR